MVISELDYELLVNLLFDVACKYGCILDVETQKNILYTIELMVKRHNKVLDS